MTLTSLPRVLANEKTSSPRISADSHRLIHSELTEKIIGVFYEVYNELGHGFLESVYEQALAIALAQQQISFQRQIGIPVWFRRHRLMIFGQISLSRTKSSLNSRPDVRSKLRGRNSC